MRGFRQAPHEFTVFAGTQLRQGDFHLCIHKIFDADRQVLKKTVKYASEAGHLPQQNVVLLFDVLHHTEHKPNRLAVATDLEGVGVAEMLDEVELFELSFQELDQPLSVLLDVGPSEHLADVQLA